MIMEKSLSCDMSGSLSSTISKRSHSVPENLADISEHAEEFSFWEPSFNHDRILEEVDEFIQKLASDEYKCNPPEIPNCIGPLLKIVQSNIAKYDQKESPAKFGENQEEDTSFVDAINRVSKIVNHLDEFPFDSDTTHCFNRVGLVQHRAMALLEYEFRGLLDKSERTGNNTNTNMMDLKSPTSPAGKSSFNSNQEVESKTEDEFPGFSREKISAMNQIAAAMMFAGYEAECFLVYTGLRLKALGIEMNKKGFENINSEDVQKMHWESLEGEIANWIQIVKHCSTNLFPAERKLCNSVFSQHPSIAQRLFIDLATTITIRFLNFANAVVLTKRYSTEKLFKFLDVYEATVDLVRGVADKSSTAQDLIFETSVTQCRTGEVAVSIFGQLENSIRSDTGRVPVASGAVHPLTRYTMNYLKYTCEYKDTLEQLFQKHYQMEEAAKQRVDDQESSSKTSPFSMKLMMVMELLDGNIEMKSRLYRDPSLRYIFLMNNGRYILQKIQGSTEIFEMVGQPGTRKRSMDLRQYHKNYQRETWSKVLQCINHEGLQVNGKVSKAMLKERFKNFNAMFDEILKTQSSWVVSDEQLQSELRVSISAVVIPAYRSFLGRFRSYLDHGKAAEKYIKYQPEDIEGLIEQLFDGNATSMGRKKT